MPPRRAKGLDGCAAAKRKRLCHSRAGKSCAAEGRRQTFALSSPWGNNARRPRATDRTCSRAVTSR